MVKTVTSQPKIRYEAIDYAKAMLIVLMVVGHIGLYPAFDNYFGSFRMGAFLLIAGLFCKKKEVPILQILENSFYQLLMPYAIMSFIAFAWCWISPYLHPELYPGINGFFGILKAALIGAVLGQDRVTATSFMPNSPLWFLLGLFWCRILAMVWLKSDGRFLHVGKLLIIVLIFIIYRLDVSIFSLRSAAVCFPFYIGGFYLKEFVFSFSKLNKRYLLSLSIAAFVFVFVLEDYRIFYDAGYIKGVLSEDSAMLLHSGGG